MKKVFQHYFFRFSALTFWGVLLVPLFFSMAFADLSAKHTEVSSLNSYTEFKDLAFALKGKMLSGSGSYEDFLLLNTLKEAVSDSGIAAEARASLLNEIAGIKQLCPAVFQSRNKRSPRETDTISSELVSLEISPSVVDLSGGSKDVIFTASATDAGSSGVDSVVIYVSPDMPDGNSFVGIWDNWDDTGWTDGQHSKTYTFPQYTVPGVYTIQKVTVEDKAGNETVYSATDLANMGAPAQFTVKGSTADTISPELTDLDISPSVADISGGEAEITFSASASDTGSGVDRVVIYVSPDMPDGYSFVGIWDNWDDTGWSDGQHSRTYTLPQYTAPGVYTIQKVEVEDKAGNETVYSADDLANMGASTQFTVEGGATDTSPPELTALDISPSVADISGGEAEITFTASATDTGSGVDSVVIYVSPDMPDSYSFVGIWDNWDDTGWTDGQHSKTYTFPRYAVPGVYTIQKVEVGDKAGNEKVYSASDLTNMRASTQFQITDAQLNPVLSVTPRIREVSKAGETVTFEVRNMGGGTMNWTASKNDSHGFISLGNDSGVNDGTITVFCENMVGDVSATITVSASGAESSQQTVEVRNYSGEIPTRIISGYVKFTGTVGLEGVEVKFSNEGGSVKTDSSGFYSKSVEYGWSGTTTPVMGDYDFIPPSNSYSNVESDQSEQNYTATKIVSAYAISGYVTDSSGSGMSGVILIFDNNSGSAITDDSGYYAKSVPAGWSGTVTSEKDGYDFNPSDRSYNNVTSDQPDQNYTGSSTTVANIDVSPTSLIFTKPKSGKRDSDVTHYPFSDISEQNSDHTASDQAQTPGYATGLIIPEHIREYWKTHRPSRKYRSRRDLPSSKDWSSYDSPVKNQGSCGSCWSFAAVALIENFANQANLKMNLNLSEQAIVSCLYQDRSGGGGCEGGWYRDAFNHISKNGIPSETCYPYREWDINCDSKCSDPDFLIKIKRFTPAQGLWGEDDFNTDDLKGALQDGPLCVSMYVPTDFFSYTGGIYKYSGKGKSWGHAVLLVGYDDDQQCFKVKNSWAESWGEGGYFRIAYDSVDDLSFGAYAATATGVYLEGEAGKPEEIVITNTGTADLVINNILFDYNGWLKISPETLPTISPGGQEKITVFVENWNDVLPPEQAADITISSNDPDNPSVVVEVKAVIPVQASRPLLMVSPPFQEGVSITDDKINISVSAMTGRIDIDISNGDDGTLNWTTVTDSGNWLTIEKGDSGTDGGTITLAYEVNTGGIRTGTVTISATGAANSPQTVEVRQAAPVIERLPYGDINDDDSVDLGDVILALQVLTRMEAADGMIRSDFIGSDADINKDGKVGCGRGNLCVTVYFCKMKFLSENTSNSLRGSAS